MKLVVPQPQPKVFVLVTPMHLFAKLHWEIKCFQRSLSSRSIFASLLPAYHAFNCAVTAWHLTDWTWEYADPESRKQLAARHKLKRLDLRAFQDAMARESRALNACQEIANGSKHRDVRRARADPHVRASTRWAKLEKQRKDGREYGTVWQIVDREGARPALAVFKEAAEYWKWVLQPFMEDRFIGQPRRRRRPV